MISTHNTALKKRIEKDLDSRNIKHSGISCEAPSVSELYGNNFLNHLFPYPYLDISFFRYVDEIIHIEEDGDILAIFGICDAGYLCIKNDLDIVLFSEDEEQEVIAKSAEEFVLRFIELVHWSTMNYIRLQSRSTNESTPLIDTISSNFGNCPFFEMVGAALDEGDAQPRRHLLTYLKDGVISQLT